MAAVRDVVVNGHEVFVEVAHDLRGALGSLRLVMSSLVDDDDASNRGQMLVLADAETQRIAAGLAALPALGLAATEDTPPVIVDLVGALNAAASEAARYGARVSVRALPAIHVTCRASVLALVLPALFLLAAGTGGDTQVLTEVGAADVVVACSYAEIWPQARHLATRLAQTVGGAAVADAGWLRLTLPVTLVAAP